MSIDTNLISESLNNYAQQLKITDSVYKAIRGRRDTVFNYIKEYINENTELSIVDKFNLGSYKIRTGVKYHDNDFDIDYGIVLNSSDNIASIKTNLVIWLRNALKEHYTQDVSISDKKSVIAIKFFSNYGGEKRAMFHLDVPLYVSEEEKLNHIKRNDYGDYELINSEPKATYERQKQELDESNGTNNKRKAILLLKHLMSRNHILGVSSIYITDKIISFPKSLNTFSLMKKFFSDSSQEVTFDLKELPKTNLIKDSFKANESGKNMHRVFSGETTIEVFKKINSKFNHKLPDLPTEELESETESYFGG